ncbi:hypothetical protein [Novosphingobium sp.]|uniref:hypothetical protein n=1 Tax=Novosphingobium sp. TaxID=1874826 RepID=UPI0035B0492E
MKTLPAIFAVAAAAIAVPAQAEPTAADVLPLLAKKDKSAVAVIMAYQNGMDWADTDVNYRTEKNLYCIPPKLSLTTDMVIATLTDWVGTDKDKLDLPLGMALLLANEDKYPCPSDKKL